MAKLSDGEALAIWRSSDVDFGQGKVDLCSLLWNHHLLHHLKDANMSIAVGYESLLNVSISASNVCSRLIIVYSGN